MKSFFPYFKFKSLVSLLAISSLISCDKDEVNINLRENIAYSMVTDSTPYASLFVDTQGGTTVDLKSGNERLKMFQALNYYMGDAVRSNKALDASKMKNMFANSGNGFEDIESLNIIGLQLNSAGVQIKSLTASSKSDQEATAVRQRLENLFDEMEQVSKSITSTASKGTAGKLGNYILNKHGIETAQVIQKSLIGAFQLDYMANILLDKGLSADNSTLVIGKNYTQLEHNWDEAYGLLTLNPVFLAGSTDDKRGTNELFLGSYIWEYNKLAYSKIHTAFLRGRVAIVNNDKTEWNKQATFIRTECENVLAAAALGYLGKWKTSTTDASRSHAIGEALGFIYALRFCTIHGGDQQFSDGVLNNLIPANQGFWDLTNDKINGATDAISAKFKL